MTTMQCAAHPAGCYPPDTRPYEPANMTLTLREDGTWAMYAPDATDDEIESGSAEPYLTGSGQARPWDWERAWDLWMADRHPTVIIEI